MNDQQLSRLNSKKAVLFKGGAVLTLDPKIGDFECADVLVQSGKIREVRPNISAATDDVEVVDAANRIVIPGFVDTHSHSYQGLLHGILPNGVVAPDYDAVIQQALTARYAPADAYAGVLQTALGLIDSGTTAMVDISQVSHSPEHTDAVIRALQNSGIRAVFAYWRGMGPKSQYPQDITRLLPQYFSTADQLLTPAMTVRADPASFNAAREAGVRAVLHVLQKSELLIALGQFGLLRAGDEFIHCTHITDEAWRLIKDAGIRTSHSPPLEMAMGHGMPSIQDALDHGVRPSLSGDHASTVSMDMFGIMRSTFNLQRLHVQQRLRAGEEGAPALLTCREVLEFATIEGARCANLDGKVGTLTPGKEADIVLLRTDRMDIWPLNNAYSAVVNLMHPGHVDAVFVAGRVRKWRGELVDVDTDRILKDAAAARDAIIRRANLCVSFLG